MKIVYHLYGGIQSMYTTKMQQRILKSAYNVKRLYTLFTEQCSVLNNEKRSNVYECSTRLWTKIHESNYPLKLNACIPSTSMWFIVFFFLFELVCQRRFFFVRYVVCVCVCGIFPYHRIINGFFIRATNC